ncbi:MAG: WG repeat-containing protein [Rhodothermales bacterium]
MKYSVLYLFAALAVSISLTGCDFISGLTSNDETNETDGIALFPVRIDGNWGFINENGRIIIEPQFDAARDFQDGLARIREGAVGYIDPAGEYVIEPRFQDGRPFSEGFAAVQVDGRWGFINRSGAFAINPQYTAAYSFKNGRAFIRTSDFDWEYIDSRGNIVRTLETPELNEFEDTGNDFNSGRALVLDFNSNQYGFIDESGNMVVDFQYAEARSFSDGMAAIKISDSWGFIDPGNNAKIPPKYIEAGDFSEGLVAVRENTNTWGYADKSGRMVIEPQFEDARPFSEGRAAVLIDGFWGYIDKSGNVIAQPDFDVASPFHKGLAQVIIETRDPNNENNIITNIGYLGRDGKYVWYPTR